MGKLYIANVTIQEQRFYYRLDFNDQGQNNLTFRSSFKFVDIPRGAQRPVSNHDLHPSQIEEIVHQLNTYGGIPVQEINRQRGNVTYLYSIDKPVTVDQITKVHNFNNGIKLKEGQDRRRAAAIAANQIVMNQTDEAPKNFTVEYEQEDISEADEKGVAEGYHVDLAHQTQTPPRGRGRAAARA